MVPDLQTQYFGGKGRGSGDVQGWSLLHRMFKAILGYSETLPQKKNQNKQTMQRKRKEEKKRERRREHLLKQIRTIIATLMILQQYPVKTNVTSFKNCYSYNWAVRVMTQW